MHVLVGGLLGGLISGVLAAVLTVVLERRRPRLADVALAVAGGFVAGAIAAATLGLGAGAATTLAGRSLGLATAGAAGAGVERAGHNVVHDRPLGEGVGTAVAFGAATGAIPLGGRVVDDVSAAVRTRAPHAVPPPPPAAARPSTDGLVHALDPTAPRGAPSRPAAATAPAEAPAARPAATPEARAPRARPALTSVHAPPPAWLAARFDDTLEAVRRGAGPAADPEDVRRFLHETYEHVNEVNALVRALGGKAREIPGTAAAGTELRGVHDFGERASVRRVEEMIESLRREPLRTRDGVPLEVPDWLARLPLEARRRGDTTVDVGKLSPWVAAGLGRNGPPDPFAIRLHNLAPHHQRLRRAGPALIEEVADRVNAMRQVRIYRPAPMPVAEIRRILREDVAAGRLPAEADALIDRALEAQLRLERSGAVNPYHLLEEGLPVGPGR